MTIVNYLNTGCCMSNCMRRIWDLAPCTSPRSYEGFSELVSISSIGASRLIYLFRSILGCISLPYSKPLMSVLHIYSIVGCPLVLLLMVFISELWWCLFFSYMQPFIELLQLGNYDVFYVLSYTQVLVFWSVIVMRNIWF